MPNIEWSEISAAIETILSNVTGVGTVLSYMPLVATQGEVQAALPPDTNDKLNAWVVRRGTVEVNREGAHTNSQWWEHVFFIDGWVSTTSAGASLDSFNELVDAVVLAFSTNISLGLNNEVDVQTGIIAANPINNELLAGIICHHVRVRIPVLVRRTVTYT